MAKKTKKAVTETPLMKQYNTIKSKYPDAILLFRVGDFYETFGEDAVKAAVEAQLYLFSHKWEDAEIKVRIGIHTGKAKWNGEDIDQISNKKMVKFISDW